MVIHPHTARLVGCGGGRNKTRGAWLQEKQLKGLVIGRKRGTPLLRDRLGDWAVSRSKERISRTPEQSYPETLRGDRGWVQGNGK